jgi:hypothetical protein
MIDLLVGERSLKLLCENAGEGKKCPIATDLGKCLPEAC